MAMEEWLKERTKEQIHGHYKALLNGYENEVAEAESLREENRRLRLQIESMESTIAKGMAGNRELQKLLDSAYVAISALGVEFQHKINSLINEITNKGIEP